MSIADEVKECVTRAIAGSSVDASEASPGHFVIRVTSTAFAGKTLLQK
jgi:stress-induced morphogen